MSRAGATWAAALACALAIAVGASTGRGARPPRRATPAPAADSVTVGLWRFDENGGTRAADSGPRRLDGAAGLDTRTDFGRFRSARVFERSGDSFVEVPWSPVLESGPEFSVEAWVRIDSVAVRELQVIAARWTPVPNQQCWVFGVTGRDLDPPNVPTLGPGWFRAFTAMAPAQRLVFGYQPQRADPPRGCFSARDLPLRRWVHVAATLDGHMVRLYVDGRLDLQFATTGPIREGEAPLLVGSAFDPRHLTSFGSDLRMDPDARVTVEYPFIGAIDELRISGVARTSFDSAPAR